MLSNAGLIQGNFVQEKSNRFLCEVCVDGVVAECYVQSSCRLGNFLDLRGETVLLKCHASRDSRTKYSLYALLKGNNAIPLDLTISNRVIEAEINRRLFCALGKRRSIKREVVVKGYKCDLLVEDTNTIIEVKSVLTLESSALFPTVQSARSVKQLRDLQEFLSKGYPVFYYFVSLSPTVKQIGINREDSDYYEAFKKCIDAGMRCDAFSIQMNDGRPRILKRLVLSL